MTREANAAHDRLQARRVQHGYDTWREPTDEDVDDLVVLAEAAGLDEEYDDPGGKADYDRMLEDYEGLYRLDFGTESDSALIRRLKKAYRDGKNSAE